jgi:tetratricopeptide (TPR) repeat protein
MLFCAFMAFASGLALRFYQMLLRIKNKPGKTDLPDAVLIGLAGGLAAGMLNNGVNFGWSYPANLVIFFFIAGIILKAGSLEGNDAGKAEKPEFAATFFEKSWPAVFLAAALLFCFGIENFLADSAYLDGVYYSENRKSAEALASVKKAARLNALNPDYRAQLASFYSDIAKNSAERDDFDTAIQYADDAIYWSDSSENSLLKGKIYLAKGDRAAAVSCYQTALSKYPFGLDAALELAGLKLSEEKYADVNLMLAKILPFYKKEYILSPYYIVPDKTAVLAKIAKLHNANATAYAKLGNNEAARIEFATAAAFEE